MVFTIKNKLSAKEAAIALLYEVSEALEELNITKQPYIFVRNDDCIVIVRIEFRFDNIKYNKVFEQIFGINDRYTIGNIRCIKNHFVDFVRCWGFVGVPKNE